MATIAPLAICACCGLKGHHNIAADCIGALRDQIAILELRLLSHDRQHFLLRVKQMRRSRNLSQVQLGRLAGVSPNTIQRIEKGKRETKESTVQALRRALTGSPAEKAAAASASSQYR
jgi:DNA-binding XRE family transcriptional regulator